MPWILCRPSRSSNLLMCCRFAQGKRQLFSVTAGDVAAWATHVAYACRVRMRSLETDDLMRKTYFGTALVKETKSVPELEAYLHFSDQCTAQARELVTSLDRFLEPDQPPGNRQRMRYALLCEYGHPKSSRNEGVFPHRRGDWRGVVYTVHARGR